MFSTVIALSSLVIGAVPALAAEDVVPMTQERFLTRAERQYVLATMRPAEREQFGHWFRDDSDGLVVAYSRRVFAIVTSPDGTSEPVEVAPRLEIDQSGLSVPLDAVAVSGGKPNTDLYMSLIVVRTRVSPPYEWELQVWSDWMDGTDGLDEGNASEDSMAVAWHGGMSRYSDSRSGRFKSCSGTEAALNIYKSDAAPNAGVGYSFNDWSMTACGWRSVKYAFATVRIRENTWHNELADIVMKYYHTKTDLEYSITFSAVPSITITPVTATWSAVVQTSITY